MDFDVWVDEVGGVDAVAKLLDVKARTVKSWLAHAWHVSPGHELSSWNCIECP